MCLWLSPEVKFWWKLVQVDRQIAEEVQQNGCRHCGGPLHQANYPRKPRGELGDAEGAFLSRHSFCCGHCRKRTTPPSLRFFGRKVYVGQLVIAACLLWQKLVQPVGTLVAGVPRRTVARWLDFWREVFPFTDFWKRMRGEVMPAVEEAELPLSLYERFGDDMLAIEKMLAFTRPLTTNTPPSLRGCIAHAQDGVR